MVNKELEIDFDLSAFQKYENGLLNPYIPPRIWSGQFRRIGSGSFPRYALNKIDLEDENIKETSCCLNPFWQNGIFFMDQFRSRPFLICYLNLPLDYFKNNIEP
ncbi:MAG: hypothetical protein IPN93_07710 [Bacteroidetes bacterium]|nr:hypothetical protein [Bacteroidota bacterium]